MSPRIGSLFAGYGGLDMAVESVYGGSLTWYSEVDKGALKILDHRYPDVPNVGDVTAVDWSQVEPVDILTGGSPCQDLSHAGRRAGMTEGTRSNLWVAMREAIAQLRPSMVVWENVGGAFSAAADSEVEPCAGCVGDGSGVHLRALGRVLGDLSSLGYDASWHSLRAADVGAPHGRLRVFVVAANQRGSSGDLMLPSAVAGLMLPTPTTRDHKDHTIRREPHRPDDIDTLARALTDVPCALLPTPAVNDMGAGKTVDDWDAWTDRMKSEHGNGNGHGKSLAIEAQRLVTVESYLDRLESMNPDKVLQARIDEQRRLLPTPRTKNNENRQSEAFAGEGGNFYGLLQNPERWGDYAAAITRWELTLGRPAPAPTMTSSKGNPQLAPAFVEWMMGLPAGWVTDAPGITRNEALRALGNGVVPQQAAHALRVMASWAEVAA